MDTPRLHTERLILRPPRMSDAPAIQTLASDRDIAANTLNIPHPYPSNGAIEWLSGLDEAMQNGDYSFAIIRRDDDAYLGTIGIHNQTDGVAEIGYWIGKPYWGQGYATEAVRRIIRFGFDHMGLDRIYASYFSHNKASRRVMEKCGMTYEGLMRQHILKWGQFLDLGFCAITRADYQNQSAQNWPKV